MSRCQTQRAAGHGYAGTFPGGRAPAGHGLVSDTGYVPAAASGACNQVARFGLCGSALREAEARDFAHRGAAAQSLRCYRGAGKADEAGDEERELRPALRAEPAGEQAAERARSVEGVEVEPDDATAQ